MNATVAAAVTIWVGVGAQAYADDQTRVVFVTVWPLYDCGRGGLANDRVRGIRPRPRGCHGRRQCCRLS